MSVRHFVRSVFGVAAFVVLALVPIRPAVAQAAPVRKDAPTYHGSAPGDSVAVIGVVSRFHDALASGDSTAALALLTDDVLILESGGVESRAEYRGHHLPADIEFARAIKSERKVSSVTIVGDAAWVAGTSTTQGEFRGRAVNSVGAELMVLRRTTAGWRIAAIHWSSRTKRS